MKRLVSLLILIVMASLTVAAKDLNNYSRDTNRLIKNGQYEEALERCLWFHNHALEHDPSMSGVRLSYALLCWEKLGAVYPPALVAMRKMRDDKARLLTHGQGTRNLFHDVASLNERLGEIDETVALFRHLDATQPYLAGQCWILAKDDLLAVEAYVILQKYAYGRGGEWEQPIYDYDAELSQSCRFEKTRGEACEWELPMYDGYPKVKRNRSLSDLAVDAGWKSYYAGSFDTAIKLFNEGWRCDKKNPDAYWGFGLIMGQRAFVEESEKNLKASIGFLQMANEKRAGDGRIVGDLAFAHTILGHYFKSEKNDSKNADLQFEIAETLFPKAYKLNPKYPPILANWSIFYFYTEQYDKAQKKADEAIKGGYQFSPAYLKDLSEKQKETLGGDFF